MKINVIDLDNTLLPYDSFRKYILIFLRSREISLRMISWVILRKIRVLDLATFKRETIKTARKKCNYEQVMRRFSNRLFADIDNSIIDILTRYTDRETINILCTASPEDYVKHLAELLGWKHIASRFDVDSSRFIHMYGEGKTMAIMRLYPRDQFRYNLSISDSGSDQELLSLFDFPLRVEGGTRRKIVDGSGVI